MPMIGCGTSIIGCGIPMIGCCMPIIGIVETLAFPGLKRFHDPPGAVVYTTRVL